MPPTRTVKRDEIIRLAYEVIDAHGFYETGVDRLFTDSGISKRTVYKYFRSKEELIAAAIGYYRQKTLDAIAAELSRRGGTAQDKLLALFDMKRQELSAADYSGCFAINARLFYDGDQPEIHEACADFLRSVQDLIQQLCREAGCAKPAATAKQIMVLFTGLIVHGQSQRDPDAARLAKELVRTLITAVHPPK